MKEAVGVLVGGTPCEGARVTADPELLSGILPDQPCDSIVWETYYAPGVLENASSNPGQLRALLLSRFLAVHPVGYWTTVGPFSLQDLDGVNNHWLSYPPQDPVLHYSLAAVYTIIMTIGVFGNLLVLYMFSRFRSLRSPANILIANLAVSDFFLLAKMPVFIYNSFHFGPVLGQIGCDIYGFLGGLTGTVSIATLAAIALDRYQVILKPLDPGRRNSRLRSRLSVVLTWMYGAALASCPLIGVSKYTPEGFLTSSSFDYLSSEPRNRAFILAFFFLAWVVPFLVITMSYSGIYRIVRHATLVQTAPSNLSRHCREHEKRRTEVRFAVVAAVIVGLWFVAWTPYAVVALMGVAGNPPGPMASMLPALFCKMASCLDPYIYAVTHPRFRRELGNFCSRQAIARRRQGVIRSKYGSRKWRAETSFISSTAAVTTVIPSRRVSSLSDDEDEAPEEEVVMVDLKCNEPTY